MIPTHTQGFSLELQAPLFLLPPENQAGGWLARERGTRVVCELGKLTVVNYQEVRVSVERNIRAQAFKIYIPTTTRGVGMVGPGSLEG